MVSVEYLKSTARLKESILSCEAERLNLGQKLKTINSSSSADGSGASALSGYYRDLCQRETSMQRRAEALLEELNRSEASLRGLSRRAEQLRARRDQILAERGPGWRDEFIDFLRRRTSAPTTPEAAAPAAAAAAPPLGGTGASAVPLLHLSQLSKSSGGGSTGAAGGGGGGGGWNTSGALLGMTESTIESTGVSRAGGGGHRGQQQQQQHRPPEPRQRISALDEDASSEEEQPTERQPGSLSSRRSQGDRDSARQDVSDLTVAGLGKLLDFVDAEMERAQPRILAAYYASSPPSDALRDELCRAANGPGGLPSHVSAVSATCLVLEELELVVATRLPGGCVFPDRMVASLSAVRDPGQLERQIDMNLTDEARSLWRRLLSHMRRLRRRTGRSSSDVARLFCPGLLHHSAASLDAQLALVVARILDLPAKGSSADDTVDGRGDEEDDEEEEEDSVTLASDKVPPAQPRQPPRPVVGESMMATAGSFVEESESEREEDGATAATAAAASATSASAAGGVRDSLNVTGNPELRASESDAHVRAYAAALEDDSADESSVTELTQQSGTNRSGFFSHHSPQRNLKDSSAYQKMLYGALGASANLGKSSSDAAAASSAKVKEVSSEVDKNASVAQSKKPWNSQELPTTKDDHDLESDLDSELENSFRLRLSGGGTFKSQAMMTTTPAAAAAGKRPPPTHAENDDEDFGGFFD